MAAQIVEKETSAGSTISRDEADRLLAEETEHLKQSLFFQALVQDPGRGICVLTPDRRLLFANDALAFWFPRSLKTDGSAFCHTIVNCGSNTFCADCPALACMESGRRETLLVSLQNGPDKLEFRISCTPLQDTSGNVLGILEIFEPEGESARNKTAVQQYLAGLEEKVQERTAELTASQETLKQKIAELDAANRELQVNRDRLIRSEKLAAVGEMSATVAHGIRNPLVSIGGFARRLLKKEQVDESSAKYLRIIVDEIDRLEVILSELLDFVRPRKLELHSVFLNLIIQDLLKSFTGEFARCGIRIQADFDPAVPALEIDVDQVRRVLQNLLYNSIDAMPEGGLLQVATALEDGQVRISIADSGEGVQEGDVEKVFHPFYTSKQNSAGLGLAVCNQIIAIHGGHIKLQRHLPHGAVFDIYLPVGRPETEN